jgi:long-chain acyl-CoA synthetase
MNLVDIYSANAVDRGSDPAITFAIPPFEGLTLTWSDLIERADAFAEDLSAAGVQSGSRIGTVLVDHPNMVPVVLAMWKLGAVPVMVDPEWGESIRSGVLSHSRAEMVAEVDERISIEELEAGGHEGRPELPPGTATIAYTSGSTAAPKGIAMVHDRLMAGIFAGVGEITSFRGDSPARFGSSMRMSGFAVFGLHYLWSAAFGAEVVVLPRLDLATARNYWVDLAQHEIDQVLLVPPLYELLARASGPVQERRPSLFICSSGALSATTQKRLMERLGAPILNCYGLTETTFACMVGDTDVRGTTTPAVGRPDLLLVRLRDESGTVVEGPGEGEIEVRGPTLSDGYYDNAEANANLHSGLWLRTGDLGRRDETGKYWIVGRSKDAVMKGGTTVYLTEVEEACVALDGILEAVAVRDDLPGGIEDLGLIVVPVDGATVEGGEVKASLEAAIGAERSPRGVVVTDRALPRIGQNKIDRRSAQSLWLELTGKRDG